MARATGSWLNGHRSSADPPPRPTMTTSTPGTRPMARTASAISAAAPSPWTRVGPDDEVDIGMAAGEDLDDVAQRRAVERGHDADFRRQRRQRPLARRLEEALGLEFLLQLLERQLQRAESLRLQVVAEQLILALRLVDAEPAARDHAQPVFGLELQVAHGGAIHHRLDLRAAILEREVEVAGVPQPAVGDLSLDPQIAETGLEQRRESTRSTPRP